MLILLEMTLIILLVERLLKEVRVKLKNKENAQKEEEVKEANIKEEEITPALITLVSTCNVHLKKQLYYEIEHGNWLNVSALINKIECYNNFILNTFHYDEKIKKQLGVTLEEKCEDKQEGKVVKPIKPSRIEDLVLQQERLKL